MDEQYTLVINGKPEGPFTVNELKAMRIKPGDFVRTPAMDDYKEAHELAELRAIFGFKFVPVVPQYFGSFDQRLLAAVIDWLLIGGFWLIIAYTIVILLNGPLARGIVTASWFIVTPIHYFIYHVIMEGSPRQATYGKQILGIKVCNTDGTDIGKSTAAKRNLAKLLSILTLGVGYLMNFFNKKQQCLHDIVAGTLVMKDRLV